MQVKHGRRSHGFTLIEVLVAILLLAIGVLGAAAMQLNALKYNQTASIRTQATFLAYAIADSMRANRNAAKNGDYEIAIDAQPSGDSVAAGDLKSWIEQIKTQLPDGQGAIAYLSKGGVARVQITLQWDESRLGGNSNVRTGDEDDAAQNTQQFIFVTEL